MAKINGSLLLVYADGTVIASQKNVTVNWEQDLPDASTKDSTGWEEHINGTRRATVDFDCLYDTTGLSAEDLMDYIINRTNLVLVIDGGGYPIVGEASVKNISVNAATEEAASLSGSFKFTGGAWLLVGTFGNRITDPDGTSQSYDTFTVSDIAVTSAINLGSGATAASNTTSITSGSVYKFITFLTLNSGQLPTVRISDGVGDAKSNAEEMVEGVNVITLTATATGTYNLLIYNSAAANFSLTNMYLFKT